MHFPSPGLTCLSLLLSAWPAKSTDQHEPPLWHHFSGRPVAVWWHWTTSIMKGAGSCPHWGRHSAGFGFAVFTCKVSASTLIYGLTKSLFHHHVFLTTLLLIKEFISQQKKCGNGLKPIEFTLITYIIIQKKLAQMNGGMRYQSLSCGSR